MDYLHVVKQENHFVAELWRYLAPFIDTSSQSYLSLDGIAARKGVSDHVLADADVPDFSFTLVGNPQLILLEAKVLDARQRVTLSRAQLTAWRTDGRGQYKPAAWVAANEALTAFFYWTHADFLAQLDMSNATVEYPKLTMPHHTVAFPEVRQLALHVLRSLGRHVAEPSV